MKAKKLLSFFITMSLILCSFTFSPSTEVSAASNLASGLVPKASSTFLNISRITDGDINTDNYASSNAGLKWVQIDLGASTDIANIKLWHYYGGARQYHDVVVRLSNDVNFASGVTTVYNNDKDNSAGFGAGSNDEYTETSAGLDINFDKVNARYVRFYSNGNTVNAYNHYVEIEIYSTSTTPEPTPTPDGNLAAGKTIKTSANFTNVSRITDGNKDMDSYASSSAGLKWVQVDLGASYDVSYIKLWHYFGGTRQYHDVIVRVSNDASFASGVTTVYNNDKNNSAGLGAGTSDEYIETSAGLGISFTTLKARYVRFYSNGNTVNGYNHYVEVEVYKTTPAPEPVPTPEGNLAAGKSITSSVAFTNSSRITDSRIVTEEYADSTPYTNLQWVQIDLGESYDVGYINIWHYFGDSSRKYHDVVVQLSNDPNFATSVTTVYNNDKDNTANRGIGTDSEYTETYLGLRLAFTAVKARYVRAYSNGSTANSYNHYVEIQVSKNQLAVPSQPNAGKILFTFDDGSKTDLTVAAPALSAKGFKATAYICRDFVLYPETTDMNLSDVNTLYNTYGWDIASHTTNHIATPDYPLRPASSMTELKAAYLQNQQWILSNGWTRGAYHVAYPFNDYDDQVISYLKSIGVLTGRTAFGGVQSTPVDDEYRLYSLQLKNNSMNDVYDAIDEAVDTGGTLILTIHSINTTSDEYATTPTNFQSIVNYVSNYAQQGELEVTTISQWYASN